MAYAIFNNSVSDVKKLHAEYFPKVGPVLEKYEGNLVCLDEGHSVWEGQTDMKRTAVVIFPSSEKLKGWYNDDAYFKVALPIRLELTTVPGNGIISKVSKSATKDHKAFVIFHNTITDPEAYQSKYMNELAKTLQGYKGDILTSGSFEDLECKSAHKACLLLGFASAEDAKKWYDSKEYQAIKGERQKLEAEGALVICAVHS
eukprot:CAMPEP_0185280288 /NCGR_PEP_ID=MMETSP1359-20130426/65711_1 /TAXON_ID=552665 /ORGANISM="Bigelowiella longifila, Strain CCMP242" /LENGTH=201 /DNA_ID=CAMNT_0027875469 /DNA_START=1 /DNA_END=606 /DNA_ORIENTATION=+